MWGGASKRLQGLQGLHGLHRGAQAGAALLWGREGHRSPEGRRAQAGGRLKGASSRGWPASASARTASLAEPESGRGWQRLAEAGRGWPRVAEFDHAGALLASVGRLHDHLLPRHLGRKQGLYFRPARPSRLRGRGWPRLAGVENKADMAGQASAAIEADRPRLAEARGSLR
eukprot:scaffold80561_cov60-Phaeocystis_antarctica.AAC.1